MSKGRNQHPRPSWLKDLPPGIVGHGPARLYFYLCAGGPNTCMFWNFRLAREFHVSKRTIKRWLNRLNSLALISIEKSHSPYRRIHPLYYKTSKKFIHAAQAKEIRTIISKISNIGKFQRATYGPQDLDTKISRDLSTSKGRASKLARPITKTAQAPQGLAVRDKDTAEIMARIEQRYRKQKAAIMKKARQPQRRYP